MHELALTENLLEITLKHATAAGAKKVKQLNIVIGQLSSVVDESVQFYWDFVAKDTIAEEAELHFERIPATFRCHNCRAEFSLNGQPDFLCPHCQSVQVEVIGGNEFRLDSIDIE
ncbi:MAG: hydrogenase maturation nickel metallochaperone HypA [Anaerolineae bacterium]|nr:hydrogenase maturation nickel metallochaperone HypA [Anaerolineae bacterium]